MGTKDCKDKCKTETYTGLWDKGFFFFPYASTMQVFCLKHREEGRGAEGEYEREYPRLS